MMMEGDVNARWTRRRVIAVAMLTLGVACVAVQAQTRDEVRKIIEGLAPGESATVGPVTYTLRQRTTGAPGADGWYRVRSVGAGFTIVQPAPYAELTTTGPTTDGGQLDSHTVAGTGVAGVRFNATCMKRRDGKPMPGNVADVARGLEARGTVLRRWQVAHGALSGVGLELATPSGAHFRGEFFAVRGLLCQMTVESPAGEAADVAAQSARYFSSFVLD